MIISDTMASVNTLLILGQGESGLAAAALAREMGIKHVIFDLSESSVDNINLAVISPGISVYSEIALKLKRRNVPVISELEFAYSALSAPVIAVTGTNGKSTVVSLIGAILHGAGRSAYVLGNIGVALSRKAAVLTDTDTAVVEVSSFQLEAVKEFKPQIAVLLNISPDHLDRHRTMEEYAAVKFRLFNNQGAGDHAVLNADDEIIAGYGFPFESQKYYISARKRVKGCYAAAGKIYFCSNIDSIKDRYICDISDIKLMGEHNLYNALAGITACLLYGIKKEDIVKTLKEFAGIRHRIEFVREYRGIKFYNDSKGTNIDSTLKAAQAMKGDTTLILGGSDKGYEYDDLFKRLPYSVKRAVVIGQTKRKVVNAAARCGFENITECGTFKEAVYAAAEKTKPGGNVLLSPACASFDMFINFEQRGDTFVEIVRELK